MTPRRLINKKAYEEMVLLKEFCLTYGEFTVGLGLDEENREQFLIEHFVDGQSVALIVGDNYTDVSKMLMNYVTKHEHKV